MTKLSDILAAADPLQHEREPAQARRDRLRNTVVTATSHDYHPVMVARYSMVGPVLVTFAAVMIGMVIIASMWSHSGSLAQAAVRFEVRLAEDQPGPGLRAARVGSSNRTVYLHPDIVVTNTDIASSRVIAGESPSQFGIDVQLNSAGAEKMQRATMSHLGKPVAILIDGNVVIAPTIKSAIGAAAVITGDYTQADAQRIAAGMIGAAP
jgi:hypothetical protein